MRNSVSITTSSSSSSTPPQLHRLHFLSSVIIFDQMKITRAHEALSGFAPGVNIIYYLKAPLAVLGKKGKGGQTSRILTLHFDQTYQS